MKMTLCKVHGGKRKNLQYNNNIFKSQINR